MRNYWLDKYRSRPRLEAMGEEYPLEYCNIRKGDLLEVKLCPGSELVKDWWRTSKAGKNDIKIKGNSQLAKLDFIQAEIVGIMNAYTEVTFRCEQIK